MERREFLATSACAIAGIGPASGLAAAACAPASAALGTTAPAAGADGRAVGQKKYAVKLTVLKRGFEKAYADAYRQGQGGPCPRVKDGQEFVVSSQWQLPAGMCEWAWGDIRTYLHDVFANGATTVGCCTDGFRPVFFKIERVEA